MFWRTLTHPSVRGSIVTLGILAALSTIRPMPWWLWTISGGLTVASVVQAVRAGDVVDAT